MNITPATLGVGGRWGWLGKNQWKGKGENLQKNVTDNMFLPLNTCVYFLKARTISFMNSIIKIRKLYWYNSLYSIYLIQVLPVMP